MKITSRPEIKLKLVFEIDEKEARGLDALVGYGFEPFIQVFKKEMGASYISLPGAEEGLRNFFETCRQTLPGYLQELENAKKQFNKNI